MLALEILCIHLQRASINEFGELVKLQGHIYFPLILDLYPFMMSGVGTKNWENLQSLQGRKEYQHHRTPTISTCKTAYLCKMGCTFIQKQWLQRNWEELHLKSQGQRQMVKLFKGNHVCPEVKVSQTSFSVEGSCHLAASELPMYRLVSVVEHFGGGGSGHYRVYRRVSQKPK